MASNVIYIVQELLRENSIVVDNKELAFQIESHPSYPSLHAITGVLDHFNVDNMALEVPTNEETLQQLPSVFLAQIKEKEEAVFVVVQQGEKQCVVTNEQQQKAKYTIADFLEKFTGIMVAVEASETFEASKDNNSMVMQYLIAFLVFGGAVPFLVQQSWFLLAYYGLSVFGLLVSYAIFKQENGESTSLGNALCSTQKTTCDTVIQSKGATLFGSIKLSDAAMVYFATLTGFTVVSALYFSTGIVALIALAALPITIYSIYYQKVIAKSWCRLCLVVVGVLWLQGGLSMQALEPLEGVLSTNTMFAMLSLAILGGIVGLSWKLAKSTLKETKDLQEAKRNYYRFKRDFTLFDALYQKEPRIASRIPDIQELVFGNPSSALEITLVTSPFCGHCSPVHTTMHKILAKYGENVHYRVRMSVDIAQSENPLHNIASALLTTYQEEGSAKALEAMDAIYSGMELAAWTVKYGKQSNQNAVLYKQQQWCDANQFHYTPVVLLNGKAYPKVLHRKDLYYYIEDLLEQIETETNMALVADV